MQLPDNYYHCFLGNGLDAVLIGPTGSMVPDKIIERGQWYKSDRYYPEDRLRGVVPGRLPPGQPFRRTAEAGWYESAPLGRTWYHVYTKGQRRELQASEQRFVPQEGTLYTQVDYGEGINGTVTTFMHPTLSLLIERYDFNQGVEFEACMAPGVWVEEAWDTDPFYEVRALPGKAEIWYDLGETQGMLVLRLQQAAELGGEGVTRCLRSAEPDNGQPTTFIKYFAIFDQRQQGGELDSSWVDAAIGRGYDALRHELLEHWHDYFAASSIDIPDPQFQSFYDAAMYHFKAMQNPVSGGLPVNNLRRTWSSHVFWDAYFIQRALLEANHLPEALESCRFFQRTESQARAHARDEFGCDGLKWDWEITHDGRKAYGLWLHQKFQIHNTASHANQIWGYYQYTQDKDFLREFYPILEGMARFFLDCVVQPRAEGGYEIGYQVGVHESAVQVRNDGINLAGAIAILRHCAAAASELGIEPEFSQQCSEVASALMPALAGLYNGRYFTAYEGSDALNMSSIAPIYPMGVIEAGDPRAASTVEAFAERYHGRMIGHGGSENGFPWAAGVLATAVARRGDGQTAWQIIESTRPSICTFGGMTEIMTDGQWNMQYFGTAEGAVCTAIHSLLLQADEGAGAGAEIRLFPALPPHWQEAAFDKLLAAGFLVSAAYRDGQVSARVHNIAAEPLTRRLTCAGKTLTVTLGAGESREFAWTR